MTRADEHDLAMPTKSHLIFIPNTQSEKYRNPFQTLYEICHQHRADGNGGMRPRHHNSPGSLVNKSKKNIHMNISTSRYFSLYTLDQHESLDWAVAGCYLFDLMVDIIPQMFHTASNWLTLGESRPPAWDYIASQIHKLE